MLTYSPTLSQLDSNLENKKDVKPVIDTDEYFAFINGTDTFIFLNGDDFIYIEE